MVMMMAKKPSLKAPPASLFMLRPLDRTSAAPRDTVLPVRWVAAGLPQAGCLLPEADQIAGGVADVATQRCLGADRAHHTFAVSHPQFHCFVDAVHEM